MVLNNTRSQPVVIYFHCTAGTDRTGEFAGSYYMKYLHYSFNKTMQTNYEVSNRKIYGD